MPNQGKDKGRFYRSNLKIKYGITIDHYNSMLAKQENRCDICGIHISELKYKLGVDHVHGEWGPDSVRGLLCRNCNNGIGKLGDDIEGLERALLYLQKYETRE